MKKLIAQHGQEALFTGDSNEDRTVWRALLHEIFGGPMPLGLPKYCMIDIVFATLVDGDSADPDSPEGQAILSCIRYKGEQNLPHRTYERDQGKQHPRPASRRPRSTAGSDAGAARGAQPPP